MYEKKAKIQEALAHLRDTFELAENIFQTIEEYICHLYGSKKKNVDEVQYFYKKNSNAKKQLIC